ARVSREVREAVLDAIRERGVVPRSRVRRRSSGGTEAVRPAVPPRLGLVEVVMSLTTSIERMDVVDGEVKLGPFAQCPPDRFFRPENRYSNSHFRRILDGVMDELARSELRGALRTTDSLEGGRLLADINSPEVGGLILLGTEGP